MTTKDYTRSPHECLPSTSKKSYITYECSGSMDIDIEQYATVQKTKLLQNITYSPDINRNYHSNGSNHYLSPGKQSSGISPSQDFGSNPISLTKITSPVSSRKSKSESLSPKKRGKRKIRENMENEVPDSSNYHSGKSSFAIISDSNLLSSNGSLYQKVQKLEQA